LTRLLATQLYHISPSDPETYVVVILVLLAVSGLAIFFPARRATVVDPVIALREE
jgi:ABC-type lipoprotein release transport system permease subunit